MTLIKEVENILVITPEYPPHNIGGGGLAYQQMCETLVKLGYKVNVLSGDFTHNTDAEIKEEIINKVSLIRLPLLQSFLPVLRAKTFPTKNSREYLKKELKKDYKFVLINGAYEGLSIYTSNLAKKNNLPYFIYSHGYPNVINYSILFRMIFKLIEALFLIPMFKGANEVFSVNPKQNMPVQTKYIPNGIDLNDLQDINRVVNIRKKHNIPEHNKIIFSIGRLNRNKGFQYSIEAVKGMDNVTYLIAGQDDGYKKSLLKIIQGQSNIVFIGQVDSELRKSYLQQSDLYLSPSLEESFGLTILEALSFGLPVIATDVGIVPNVISDKINGLRVKPGNATILKETINQAFKLSFNRNKVLDYNKRVLTNYDWENIATRLMIEINKSL